MNLGKFKTERWAQACELLVVVLLLAASHFRQNYFFRDFGILWEGAYRMALGQMPYVDFGLPMGPVPLVIPAFFFKLFGANYDVFSLSGAFVSILTLIFFRSCLISLKVKPFPRAFCCAVMGLYHLISLQYPWYNSVALAFEMAAFAAILWRAREIKCQSIWLGLIAGVCVVLSLLSKQDYGGMALASGGGLVLLTAFLYSDFFLVVGYPLGLLLAGLVMAFVFRQTDFLYWFNYGQSPHANRLSLFGSGNPLAAIIEVSPTHMMFLLKLLAIHVALLAFWWWRVRPKSILQMKRDPFFLHVCFAFALMLQNLITVRTSGLPSLSGTYYIAPALALIFAIGARLGPMGERVLSVAVLVLFMSLPTSSGVTNVKGWAAGKVMDFAGRPVTEKVVQGRNGHLLSFGSEYLPEETAQGLMQAHALMPKQSSQCPILNMTELTPLALDWGFTPCLGMPLWFHTGVSLFPRELQEIKAKIQQHEFGLVLLQSAHENWQETYAPLADWLLENGYVQKMTLKGANLRADILVFAFNSDAQSTL